MKKHQYLALVLLIILSVSVYLNSLYGDFLLDDEILIQKYPAIRSFSLDLMTYRLVRTFSYAADYFFWGLNPLGYHLSNILYNTLTVWAAFLLTRRLTGLFVVSLITALLFAVHPIHTEAVSYLSGRRDILSALFFLWGLFFYVKGRQEGRLWPYPLVLLCYVAGILSKEMAITLPLMIFVYEWITRAEALNTGNTLRVLVEALVDLMRQFRWAILGILFFVSFYIYVVVFVQGASALVRSEKLLWWGGTPQSNFTTVSLVIATYIYKLFFPIILHVDYHQFPYVKSFLDPRFLFSFTFIVALLAISCFLFKRNRIWTFSIWWFFVTLLPVMHIIPHHILLAEHYLYLPSYGFCLALGLGLHAFSQKQKLRVPMIIVTMVLISLFSVRTIDRNQDWQDIMTLMRKGLQSAPGNPVYHFFLGRTYALNGLFASANRELALSIGPRHDYSDMHAVKALVLFQQGDYIGGVKETKEALKREPTNPMALYNMGYYAQKMKDDETAVANYMKVEPHYESGQAILNMAHIFMKNGDLNKAEDLLQKLLNIDPKHTAAVLGLADVYTKTFRFEEAIRIYRDLLESQEGGSSLRQDEIKRIDRGLVEQSLVHVNLLRERFELAMERLDQEQFCEGHRLLSELHIETGDYDTAERELKKVSCHGEEGSLNQLLLANLYLKGGNVGEAERLYTSLIESKEAHLTETFVKVGEFYASTLRFEQANELFRRALIQEPHDPRIKTQLKWSLKLQDLVAESRTINASGYSAGASLILSDVYLALGRKEDAAELLENQLEADRDDERLLERLADIYATMGYPYWQRTINTYRHLLSLGEENALTYRKLGEFFYGEIQDYENALYCLRRSLALDPTQESHEKIRTTVQELNQYVRLYLGASH